MTLLCKFSSISFYLSFKVLLICINLNSVTGSTADVNVEELGKKLRELHTSNLKLRKTNEDLVNEIGSIKAACNNTILKLKEHQQSAELELFNQDSNAQKLFAEIENEEQIQQELETNLAHLLGQTEMLEILHSISLREKYFFDHTDTNQSSQSCGDFVKKLGEVQMVNEKSEVGTRSLNDKHISGHFQSLELELKLKFAHIEESKLRAKIKRLLLKKKQTVDLCDLMVSDENEAIENTKLLLNNSTHAVKVVKVDLVLNKVLTQSLGIEYKLAQIFKDLEKDLILHYQG